MRNTDLTPSQAAELEALAAMPDEDIDTSDIPEITEFSNPRRGVFAGSPNVKLETKPVEQPATNSFGGPWTAEKLEILSLYLNAYTTALKNRSFELVYVDAFAGTGAIDLNPKGAAQRLTQSWLSEEEHAAALAANVIKGSARVALEVDDKPFDKLIFVEQDPTFAEELISLKGEFPNRNIQVEKGEANQFLRKWCEAQDATRGAPWRNQRAVIFLDPFATEVDWQTVEAIGRTQSVDLWMLFPLSTLSRVLPVHRQPDEEYAPLLDRVFGSPEWRELYRDGPRQMTFMAGNPEHTEMVREDQQEIVDRYLAKLKTAFASVAPTTRWFCNRRNSPLFAMMFAAANPGGAPIAVRIADHLLKRW